MKVLLSHRYFWPDTAPYAFLLRSIGEDFCNEGHDVHIYCSKPSYRSSTLGQRPKREKLTGLSIYRCWVFQEEGAPVIVRAINVLLYAIGLFFRVLILRPDVVTASTFPPVFAAYMGSLGAKIVGSKFIYHMQDIHPEVSEISGGLMGKRWFAKVFRWLDNQTLRRSEGIVVLSVDMENTLRKRELGDLPIHVINNFELEDDGVELEVPLAVYAKEEGKRRVIFAGNLGRFQNLMVLAEGVVCCLEANPDLELLFLGDGKEAVNIKAKWGHHPQVKFAPFLPLNQAKALIAEADVGLVSLLEGVYKVAYPSKVLTYLGMGIPILVLVEPHSDMASKLGESGVAAVPESQSPSHVSEALISLLDRNISKQTIISWYGENFRRELSSRLWLDILSGGARHEQYED